MPSEANTNNCDALAGRRRQVEFSFIGIPPGVFTVGKQFRYDRNGRPELKSIKVGTAILGRLAELASLQKTDVSKGIIAEYAVKGSDALDFRMPLLSKNTYVDS